MSYTSSTVKNRYNKKNYKQFSTQIKPELYEEINNFCKNNNLSKPAFLKLAIDTLLKNK